MRNDKENPDLMREVLFEQHSGYDYLREQYRNGQLAGLDDFERELLQFCHDRDMRKYLKENVWDKPIVLDEDGGVNYNRTKYVSSYQSLRPQPLNEAIPQQEQQYPQQQQPFSLPGNQKFYYLYDDNGNLVAAIPKR